MTAEPQAVDGKSQETVITVSSQDFNSVDIEAPIRDSRNVDCLTLGKHYKNAASVAKEVGNEPALRTYTLLSIIMEFHFKPEDQSEPYGPLLVFNGKRTLIPSDLRGEQSAVIADIVSTIQNPGLRARLADVTWLNNRSLPQMVQQAVDAYCKGVQLVLDGKGEFFNQSLNASDADGCGMLQRACQIARATGWNFSKKPRLTTLVRAVICDAINHGDYRGFLDAGGIALQFGIADNSVIISNAEAFAASENVDPYLSQDLWELAARAHNGSGNHEESNRCLLSAAECHVKIADAAGGKGMVAANAIMSAIQALRKLPSTGQRRQELKECLPNVQASVRDEMGVISTRFDLTEHVKLARQAVGGLGLWQALAEFIQLAQSPDPDDLRDQAMRISEENPLSSIMPFSVVDQDGRVVTTSPGLHGDERSSEIALNHLIARHEKLRRQIDVRGLIEPARCLIQSEHSLEQRDLRLLVQMTPFVPADRIDLITIGLARFFGGDFFSALHILVPQIESSLRHILKQAGGDPSKINNNMTQEDRTLSVMLKSEREPLEQLLGCAIVFELENLFDFRGGPTLRHRLAHGQVSADECYDTDSIYACWFVFRLLCLPLFPNMNAHNKLEVMHRSWKTLDIEGFFQKVHHFSSGKFRSKAPNMETFVKHCIDRQIGTENTQTLERALRVASLLDTENRMGFSSALETALEAAWEEFPICTR